MAKKSSVFSHTRDKLVPLSLKVARELKTRIDGVKTPIHASDNTLVFNVAKICWDALETAVLQAEAELSQFELGRGKHQSHSHD